MLNAIINRRSIRKYKPDNVPQPVIEEIINAGMLAPSSKNRQPWKFIVATGDSKDEVVEIFKKGIEREKADPFLYESTQYISGAEYTLKIMQQAPCDNLCCEYIKREFFPAFRCGKTSFGDL